MTPTYESPTHRGSRFPSGRNRGEKEAAEWSPADVRAQLPSPVRRELVGIRTSSQTQADREPRRLQRWLDFYLADAEGPRATHRRAMP